MRIFFATSIDTWGGGEEWMLASATGLAGRGHEVAIAGRPGSPILARAREAGIPTLDFAFRADVDPLAAWRVFRYCRRRRIEALCVNMDRVLRVAGPPAKAAGVGVILPRRGSEFPLKDGLLYRLTYRRIATGMIVNSRATAETLVRDVRWRPAGRVHVLPNALDLARFERTRPRAETRTDLGLSESVPIVLAVGELTTRKNLSQLLRVAPALLERHPELRILLAGEGDDEAALRDLAAGLGLGESVRFLGFRRDVPDLLAAADVLVHPSRVEGFGYVLAEAMAAGLPVVATDASSIPEIVADGETGLLVPPGDDGAWRDAIAAYLGDPERRARDGRRGRERVQREFSLDRRLDELESILKAEIARARPGGSHR